VKDAIGATKIARKGLLYSKAQPSVQSRYAEPDQTTKIQLGSQHNALANHPPLCRKRCNVTWSI